MILTRMLFSCLVGAEFLDTAVIAVCFDCMSLPMRGAWIKIRGSCQATITGNVSGWQMVHLWC